MDEIKQKTLDIMTTVFNVPASDIPDNAGPGVIESWDSLKHMNLILALEEGFDIRFSDDEMVDLLDIPTILLIIKEKLDA